MSNSKKKSESTETKTKIVAEDYASSDSEEESLKFSSFLSESTLAALQEFYTEQNISIAAQRLDGETAKIKVYGKYKEYIQAFPEDWRLSQFWYDEETSTTLANEVIKLAGTSGRVACISCPSVFRSCRGSEFVDLYEYDKRFEVFGKNYIFYDYNLPEDVPESYINSYSVIIVDPPVLALECLEKVTLTVKKLAAPDAKIILCTGAVMEKEANSLLSLVKTSFIPKHKKNLANEFSCFTNFSLQLF